METKRTATEWLNYNNVIICEMLLSDKISQSTYKQLIDCFKLNLQQAKQIEEEQIKSAWKDSNWDRMPLEVIEYSAEEYYNETYGN